MFGQPVIVKCITDKISFMAIVKLIIEKYPEQKWIRLSDELDWNEASKWMDALNAEYKKSGHDGTCLLRIYKSNWSDAAIISDLIRDLVTTEEKADGGHNT